MTSADRIEAAAAQWVARRDAGPLAPDEEARFEEWCAANPRNLGAFVRLEAVNARLGRAAALQGLDAETRPSRKFWIPAAIAASLALAVASTWQLGLIEPDTDRPPTTAATYATQVGEQYRTSLPDGSLIELNTATKLAVGMEPRRREIRMDHGEAVFEVAKDAARPFVVRTALGDVRAVGTMFSVRIDSDLQVVVSEGIVAIERDGREVARVTAGETYSLGAAGEARRAARDPDEIRRALAWREGKVAFAGETLAHAAAELNRYNKVKIEIADPSVGAMRFGGYFRATDPEGFTAALQSSLPVKAERRGEAIILSAR